MESAVVLPSCGQSAVMGLQLMRNYGCGMQVQPVQTRDGGMALQFEHPTLAGTAVGGWMNRAQEQLQVGGGSVSGQPA
jgi:hypothetical protein